MSPIEKRFHYHRRARTGKLSLAALAIALLLGSAACTPTSAPTPPRDGPLGGSTAADPILVPTAAPAAVQSSPTPEAVVDVPPPAPTPQFGPTVVPTPAPPVRVAEAPPPPPVTARHVAILDHASGALLYGHLPHARVPPASTTKIVATILALARADSLERRLPITVDGFAMQARDGSSIMGLEPGERLTLETLLYGMMLPSGNDAAEQVALALAGSRERYVEWMNQFVTDLDLRNTHFANPSGMDAPGHYSSAYDMAMLARAAMRNPVFREIAGAPSYARDGYALRNLNSLIGQYPGADGVKIGYTPAAGSTMVASATRDGHRVYVSLMGSQGLVGDATALFDWVWQAFDW